MKNMLLSRGGLYAGVIGVISFIALACNQSPVVNQETQVKDALTRLLQREAVIIPADPGDEFVPPGVFRPSVVIEEMATKKFVQFSGARDEKLILDLPSQTLDRQERVRAEAFFAKLGVVRQPGVHDEYTYNLNLGNDVDRAAELTVHIFRDVYHFPESVRLLIKEN
jgi:hypothetical protein